MGFFDKKYCDICGEKIGLLGNRKLEDGNLCKECAKKLSPWFEERRHSTVDDIKRQLEYRKQNEAKVQNFHITRQIPTKTYNVYIDDTQGNFTIAHNLDTRENPDILPLSSIVQCRLDIKQDQIEETYTKDGETVSYQPPVYKYEYNYSMKIQVRSPWFDDMNFRLHNFAIEQEKRAEIMEMERTGYEIVAALTGQTPMGMQQNMMGMNGMQPGMSGMNGMPMNNGMNGGMNNGMPGMNGMPMNNGMNGGMNNGMQSGMPGMNGMPMNNGMNGGMNNGMQSGMPGMNGMPMNNGMNGGMNGGMQPGMSGMNGMPMNNGMNGGMQPGSTWKCKCGAENTGKFCEFCGELRPY